MYARLRGKKQAPLPARETRESAEKRLAWCVGTERFQRRDPLRHVTESFQMTFDRIGRSHARALSGEGGRGEQGQEEPGAARAGLSGVSEARYENRSASPGHGVRKDALRHDASLPAPMQIFSKLAFQRGALSASVLAGTGKLMLVSCLKRTIGQSGAKRLQEETLFGIGSQVRNVPGHDPDQMAFNRSFTRSAVGVVVDTLRDARRTVDALSCMAQGVGELGEAEGETLRRMYPFLDDSRERLLCRQYRDKLGRSADAEERAVLQNAIVHTQAVIAKKAQMKNEFINKLRFVSDRATEALSELEAAGAAEEVIAAVLEEEEPPEPFLPPEDGGDGRFPDVAAGQSAEAPEEEHAPVEAEDEPGPES